jgi:hypothetical protein
MMIGTFIIDWCLLLGRREPACQSLAIYCKGSQTLKEEAVGRFFRSFGSCQRFGLRACASLLIGARRPPAGAAQARSLLYALPLAARPTLAVPPAKGLDEACAELR